MFKIKGLYKEKKNNILKGIDINIDKGNSVSIECSNEISDLLVNLILGKEIPGKGEIFIEGIKNSEYIKKNIASIGVVLREDALYENMTIESYMKFFADIFGNKVDYKEILMGLALLDIANTKISKLSYSQKRRVSFARERLKQPKLLIFQEPILNMDLDGAISIIENIDDLCSSGTAVLITSVLFKDTIMIGEKAYRLDAGGLVSLGNNREEYGCHKEEVHKGVDGIPIEKLVSTNEIYKIEKIPVKIDDKILLFDPIEIDYIESDKGISNIYISGEKFPCTISLTDLEERLKYFGFFRCHRSYIVNLQRVREIITWTRNSYSLSLDDKIKSSVPLSKGRLDELKTILRL
ncbi:MULTISPECIES: LytTR family transcriptional regulator DNA-binding domain-containing protein [Clostridium]|uniref:LytTR family transcriptional regulator DNA-binding domain-containing protein n=1 Tax=Clostridium frigoriphilum TaxID=443253 RepID=A0ABU7UUH7_9CLOT|nr:LytTR family transcriptional regulator DNA-binding domain-containing protein [Clostridium sp. DSM 17811]MBU3101046.1 LytTR family transcriptional regulator DNA-binding domain-containing protein [Clostridium sp. DSM 17811]